MIADYCARDVIAIVPSLFHLKDRLEEARELLRKRRMDATVEGEESKL